FYDALGWTRADNCPPGLVAYDLYGATLGLYPRADLARDTGLELPRGSGAVTLSCNVREKGEVAAVTAAASAAGAKVVKPPHDVFWGGHIAYFADPDGHIWEVAFNPHAPLGPNDEFQWNGA
ncbi:MAG: VOC family protein, partial [Pseudomonadota bacterium]